MAEESENLNLLEAHGRAFLEAFGLPSSSSLKRTTETSSSQPWKKRRRLSNHVEMDGPSAMSPEDSHSDSQSEVAETDFASDSGSSEQDSDEEVEHTNLPTPSSSRPNRSQPEVITFAQPGFSRGKGPSQPVGKSFMSSKVSRITSAGDGASRRSNKEDSNSADELDKSHVQNDKELHKLLHTRLLSSTFNPEVAASESSAKRKKALEGRILELAEKSKLGKGEKDVRKAEKKKAILRIREGMKEKESSRAKQSLEEAKNVGNYHPALKKLFDPTADEPKPKIKRDRGLSMGVGHHTSSGLRISKAEIESVVGRSSDSKGRKGHFGGRGGKFKGKGRERS